MSNQKPMNIHNIRIDGNTQARVSINQDVVAEYKQVLTEGDYLPEVIVFFDGVDHWLADGFHRYHAHLAAGKASIAVDKRKGTQRDAILFSLSANTIHGLRPTSDDKRKAVGIMLADPEWAELSDRAIARHCGCSHPLVAEMRNPKPVAPTKPAASGNSSTAPAGGEVKEPGEGGNSSTPAAPAKTKAQAENDENAQAAHGDDDPVALLEASYKEIEELRALLAVAEADDKQAEVIKFKRIADVARIRQNELMDTVNAREGDLKKQANWLRRIGVAMGEEDYSKLAAKVEAMARATKAAS